MNIKSTLTTLLSIYEGSRQVGHTTAAVNGVLNTPDAVLVFARRQQLKSYRPFLQREGMTVRLDHLSNLRGRSCPIVLDNAAVYTLAADSLREIERLEAENAKLKRSKDELSRDYTRSSYKRTRLEIQVHELELQVGKAEARYNRAVGEIAWLRLPLWQKVAKYLRYPSVRRWRREAGW